MKAPRHIAIVMDGNRRWARQRGLDVLLGHRAMAKEGIKRVVQAAIDFKVEYLTLWAFSTENWSRDKREVEGLMQLFRELFASEAGELHKLGVRINAIGDLSRFDQDIQDSIQHWREQTKDNSTITVTFALNYGGRDEILRAVARYATDLQKGKQSAEKLSEQDFSAYLDTTDLPDPDLIIRTSGEQRLSGFLLWQSNYAEFYFPEVLMPDFDKKELGKALEEFRRRQRRHGQ